MPTSNGSEKNQTATPGLLIPADLAASENNEKLKMQVFVAGEIISVEPDDEFAPGGDFMLIEVKTPIGPLPLVLNPADSGENLKPLLKKGNLIRATGWLFGDAAAGQYASGMVLDLEHDLRLFVFGFKGYDFSRTRQIFSEKCQYFRKDELRAEGPEAVVEALNGVAKVAKERKYASNFVYGQIFLKNSSEIFQQGEKCLVFLDDEGQFYFLMCARTDETGRISKLFTVYSSDEIEDLRMTTDFQLWCEGFPDAPVLDEQTGADKKLSAYYENPELSDQLHGDGEAFFGEPFFGFGDMLDILIPGEDAEIMAKVIQWGGEAQSVGLYQSGGFKGTYLDYPEKNARLGMQFALAKKPDQKSFEVRNFYPFMQGHRQSLKIVATFDWPEKVCGYIAAKWRDKAPINCFAPSYRLWNEKIIFDQQVELALSGLALDIGPAPHPHFTVEKGQFYEINLAQFLYENPDKTISDFEAPVVHTEDSVLFLPRGETCIYELQAPVKKVESVKFAEKDFTRLLMPIARDLDDDEELCAWIYASDKELGEFRPKPGDPVACVIWLCVSWAD